MTDRSIVVISAGLNEPSTTRMLADLLGSATAGALQDLGVRAEVKVIELRDHARELVNQMLTGVGSPLLAAAMKEVAEADGLIAVTPVFSASYSGLFKVFVDVLDQGTLEGKPVLIAATAGTPRHSMVLDHALRPLFSYLGAVVVPTGVFAATEDWGAGGDRALSQRADRAGAELAAQVAGRRAAARDPFEEVTSFQALLAGGEASSLDGETSLSTQSPGEVR